MSTNVFWKHWRLRNSVRVLLVAMAGLACASPALADQEASNVAHVTAGPYGRCYAKSVPKYIYDPQGEPRQQGVTSVYRVGDAEDVLVHVYDWFSQRIFVKCGPLDDIMIVRVGPWQRGHDPRTDHLALAFYRAGALLKSYSTLDISGAEAATDGGFSGYKNASASVSHYTVFASGPDMTKVTTSDGPVFAENWFINAITINGRSLSFDMETGQVR